jgi:teichuronic acid biosynthesis glycosyltransferase TuaC
VRVLVVTNMYPSAQRPWLGPFVRDQVEAFRRRDDLEVELFAFPPGPRALARAAITLRRRYAGQRFDIVHAHFGLTAWPAILARLGPVVVTLHGNDLLVRRSYVVTRAALPFTALTAAVSREFSENIPGAGTRRRVAILPVGIGGVPPDEVPYWVNAANAVLVPSAKEAYGLSVIEALACGVPAIATPVGIHPVALHGIEGAYCGEWDRDAWRAALRPHVEAADPRVDGRARAELFSADAMAARVVDAWRDLLAERAPTS